MGGAKDRLWFLLNRMKKKKVISEHDHSTELKRCLTTTHLTFMGVGCTVGVGIYVLVGVAAKEYAGPGVLLSFLMAGLVTVINAICFAEFGARIPKTGATYTYVYESASELLAFLVGWMTLVGYITSGAIAARAWSGYLDSLFNNYIHESTVHTLGKVTLGPPFSESLDFLACAYEIVVIVIISLGVQASAFISTVLAGVSVCVLLFVTIMGLVIGDYRNITNTEHGGFLPFGIGGVMAGTAACFYAFQGFNIICMSAEECKTPGKSIPRAIFSELLIVTLLYVGSSCGLILLVPYSKIDIRAPLPSAFAYKHIEWAKYVVSIGPTLGISNLNILNLYNISRHVYCMSSDGLFMKAFLKVNRTTKVPVRAAVVMGLLVSLFALLFDISNLVSFNVISIFLSFVISNGILLLSRREERSTSSEDAENRNVRTDERPLLSSDGRVSEPRTGFSGLADRIGLLYLVCLVVFTSLGLGLQLVSGIDDLLHGRVLAFVCLGLLLGLLVFLSVLMSTQTGSAKHNGFSMPLVPYLPVLSIVINIVLLAAAANVTGVIGYVILVALGFGIYVALVLFSTTSSGQNSSSSVVEDWIGVGKKSREHLM
ncbi:cationic amino acid transporter 4-like isoform X2 [Haliotis rubra]|uniref:cationic amino acid transporter 4-like isoform X2 n=1 Tax=Haliotis rubra TaxID=36100 RepID=UPI001EE636C9|nr:cationic amino acid transporter 4-like isoform X2 [Haliotis rubra]